MRAPILAAVLAAALLAGCTGDPPADGTTTTGPAPPAAGPMPADPMPEGPGHDHTDPEAHKFLWNYAFSARDPLLQNAANVAGIHALDLQAGHLFGAIYGSHALSVDGGVAVWDVATDPAKPRMLGRWTIPGSMGGDRSMEATSDGRFGHVNPFAAVSAYLIDFADKSRPVVADVLTPAGGAGMLSGGRTGGGTFNIHSVAVHSIQGQDHAFVFGDIYRIERSEAQARLVQVGRIDVSHDLYLRDTPWNTTWALVANGNGGLVISDVTDPTRPAQLAVWDLPERKELEDQGISYYFHTADVAFQADGNITVVLSSEDWEDHVSPLWVLDATGLRGAVAGDGVQELPLLGRWQNPGNHTAVGTSFSLHNPRYTDDGILTITSYHGGVWQLDTRTPELRERPQPIAYAVYADGEQTRLKDPAEQTVEDQLCGLGTSLDAPSYMDVEVGEGGTLYVADNFMGLYTFTPTPEHPVYR
jgi:hypothetical protein